MPPSTETGSGPVNGEEIRVEIIPNHQKIAPKTNNSIVKFAFSGAAVTGGIVGLYLLYRNFFGNNDLKKGDGRKLRKRGFKVANVEEEMKAVYTNALEDEGFLEFLEEIQGSGLLDEFA
jgi:hypothetical protein